MSIGEGRIAWTLLRRSTLRHWIESRWSYLLIIAIVAVGVGSLNGIRQASRAATANFGLFNEAVSGRSEFLIEAPVGALKEDWLFDLAPLSRSVDWHLFPVVEGPLTQLDDQLAPVRQLRLIGLDLMSVVNLPRFIEQDFEFGDGDNHWYDWVGRSNRIWVSTNLLELIDAQVGDSFPAAVGGRVHDLVIAGALGSEDAFVPEDLVIADLPAAQAILSRSGEIDRVEVIVNDRAIASDPDALGEIEARIRVGLPEGFAFRGSEERAADRAGMTAAFRLNLMILSLIAMLVGAYLILQALDAAVVRRRNEIATLKSLGVSGASILLSLLLEAGLIGLLGSALGIGFGMLLATGAVHVLADTVNALYFATSVDSIQLRASDLWIGGGIGFLFSLLAGWLPARDAMFTPPAQILSRGDWSPGFNWLRNPWVGGFILVLGVILLFIPSPLLESGSRVPIGGFLAAGCWIFGAALLSGEILVFISKIACRFQLRAAARMAISRLADGSSRHRLAVAGMVVAVGMVTGMLQMVGSFRGTIESWFDVRFQAELYVSERGSGGASGVNGIDAGILERLVGNEAIRYADTLYVSYVDAPRGKTILAGINFDKWTTELEQIWHTEPGKLRAVEGAEPVLVSETFARRFDVLDGGRVELQTPLGIRAVSPIGIYSDYGNEFGAAAVDIEIWKAWIGLDRPINTSVFLNPDVDVNEVRDAMRLEFPGLDIRNAKELRDVALGVFEQTFKVTSALNAIGVTVAVVGLVLGLLAMFAESASTWKTLTYLGFPSRSFVWTAGLEGAGVALSAWIGGTLVGMALGWLLIYVINVQSFGWTLVWELPFAGIAVFGLMMVACGLIGGLMTGAWWHARSR